METESFDWSTVTASTVSAVGDLFTVNDDLVGPVTVTGGATFASPAIKYDTLFEGSRLCQRKISSLESETVYKGFHVYKPADVTAGCINGPVHAFGVSAGFADSVGTYRIGYESAVDIDRNYRHKCLCCIL